MSEAALRNAASGPPPALRVIDSPSPETRAWVRVRLEGDVHGFRDPAGITWVSARLDETPELVVRFPKIPGLPETRLVRSENSASARAAATRSRRQQRELTRRGY